MKQERGRISAPQAEYINTATLLHRLGRVLHCWQVLRGQGSFNIFDLLSAKLCEQRLIGTLAALLHMLQLRCVLWRSGSEALSERLPELLIVLKTEHFGQSGDRRRFDASIARNTAH